MKIDRRKFIEKTSAFAGLIFLNSAKARSYTDSGSTSQYNRTSPGIIDCQSHLFSEDMVKIMEKRTTDPTSFIKDGTRYLKIGDWIRIIPQRFMDVDVKLAAMDAAGIAMTALSINDPGPEWFGDDGAEMAHVANDFVAGIIKKHPTRFFGMIVLPWQDIEASLSELDRCVNQLGMKGLHLYTNFTGRFPDEPEFRPILSRAAELGIPAYLHPAKPVTTDATRDYEMVASLGNMFENTIALSRLIMSGILDDLPDLKLVCPHLGGTLPYIIGRVDHQSTVLKRGPRNLTRKPSEYLKSCWLDIVSPLPHAMKFAVDFMGVDKLLYASDHPWVDPQLILDHLRSLQLPEEDENRILRYNALELFQI